jgi:hypothetical protein
MREVDEDWERYVQWYGEVVAMTELRRELWNLTTYEATTRYLQRQPESKPDPLPIPPKRNRGRKPTYTPEVMYEAVRDWRESLTESPRPSRDEFEDDEEWEPSRRMTKDQFLANRFNNGELNNMPVKARNFDKWAENFDSGYWEIPEKYRKQKKKRK